jgi:glutathione peroxidase
MNVLQTNYTDLVIIGFPCNQFARQEPGANAEEIFNCIKYVRPGKGFEPNFILTEKIEVNGETEYPLYTFLKESCPTTQEKFSDVSKLGYTPLKSSDIRWNWEKFLIDDEGKPITRFHSSITPDSIADDVVQLQSKLNISSNA